MNCELSLSVRRFSMFSCSSTYVRAAETSNLERHRPPRLRLERRRRRRRPLRRPREADSEGELLHPIIKNVLFCDCTSGLVQNVSQLTSELNECSLKLVDCSPMEGRFLFRPVNTAIHSLLAMPLAVLRLRAEAFTVRFISSFEFSFRRMCTTPTSRRFHGHNVLKCNV